jgi:hypothetical protein
MTDKLAAEDSRSFCIYLFNCTDRQLQESYEKEHNAGRQAYADLAASAASRRSIDLTKGD